jgi:GLPGLI family protein
MKSIIIALIFVLASEIICAQNYSGTIQYIVAHDWLQKRKSSEFVNEKDVEMTSYVWGSNNVYKEYSILEFNPTASLYKETDENVDHYNTYSWRSSEYLIYRNIENNETYDVIKTLNKLYVIEDTIMHQNWKIRNDMKEVAGHICMNAYCRDTLRDKDIIAWFALDMPIPYGPDRYGGLPGMILEINENNGAVVITASSIIMTEEEIKIEKPTHKRRVKKVTEKEYTEIIEKSIAESKKIKRPYFYNLRY